jgi:ankyrin repeat protein
MSREDVPVWDLGLLFDGEDVDETAANSTHECLYHSHEAHADFVRLSLAGGTGLRCHFCARALLVDCHQVVRFYDEAHVDDADALGETPLYIAARANQIQTARYLLRECQAHPDALSWPLDPEHSTAMSPVHIAAVQKHWNMVLLLAMNGANVYADYNSTAATVNTPNTGCSVVRLAVQAGQWALVEHMWGNGLVATDMAHDPAAQLKLEFVFLIAARNGVWGVFLLWLISMQYTTPAGASCELCNTTDEFGQSCLDYAIFNRRWDIVEKLLVLGALVAPSKWPGDTLIIAAASNKALSVVHLLLSCDASVQMPPIIHHLTTGGQAMHAASQNGRWHVVEALCAVGVDGRLLGHASMSPLMIAARSNQWRTVALILDSVMKFKRPESMVRCPASPNCVAWLCGNTNDNGDGDDREENVSSYSVHADDRHPNDNNPVVLAALAGEWDVVCTLLTHFNADQNAVSYNGSATTRLFEMAAHAQEWRVCLYELFPLVLHPNQRTFSMQDCLLLQWVTSCKEWKLALRMVSVGYVCVHGRHDMRESIPLYQDMMKSAIFQHRWDFVYQMLECGVPPLPGLSAISERMHGQSVLVYVCKRIYTRAVQDRDDDDSDYSDDGDYSTNSDSDYSDNSPPSPSDDSNESNCAAQRDGSDADFGDRQEQEDMDSGYDYDSGDDASYSE